MRGFGRQLNSRISIRDCKWFVNTVAPGDTRYLYLYGHHVGQEKDQVGIGFVVKSRCHQV